MPGVSHPLLTMCASSDFLIHEPHEPQGQLVAVRVFNVVSSLYHKQYQEKVLSANSIFYTKVLFTNSNLSNFPIRIAKCAVCKQHFTRKSAVCKQHRLLCLPCYYVRSSKRLHLFTMSICFMYDNNKGCGKSRSLYCCRTRIRTTTNRTKTCCATITPYDNQ
jgi:hypothetical protein